MWFHAICASKGCPAPYLQTFIKHKCKVHILFLIYMLRLVIEYIHTAYMYLDFYMPIHIYMFTAFTHVYIMYVRLRVLKSMALFAHLPSFLDLQMHFGLPWLGGQRIGSELLPRKNWGATQMGKWCRDQLKILREIDVINGNYPFKPGIQKTACRKNNVLRSRVLQKE